MVIGEKTLPNSLTPLAKEILIVRLSWKSAETADVVFTTSFRPGNIETAFMSETTQEERERGRERRATLPQSHCN